MKFKQPKTRKKVEDDTVREEKKKKKKNIPAVQVFYIAKGKGIRKSGI